MIATRLMGGLGNQMFQYAAGKALAQRLGTSLELDLSFLNKNGGIETKRSFALEVFRLKPVLLNDPLSAEFLRMKEQQFYRVLNRNFPALLSKHYFAETKFSFDSRIQDQKNNTLLDGFWQTEKYFKESAELIRADFEFAIPLDPRNAALVAEITSSDSAGIHVRRGDYVKDKITNAYHGVCNVDYYRKAMEELQKVFPDMRWYVFSDDADWVRTNLTFLNGMTVVDFNTGAESYRDMQLMSLCRHQVIANSSFSWWAAWLNRNKDKTVIAPEKWFLKSGIDTSDIYPEDWIKL
jgi:hypothetical protein